MTLLYILMLKTEVVDVVEVDDLEGETIRSMAYSLGEELGEARNPVDRYAVALRSTDSITMVRGTEQFIWSREEHRGEN